MKKFTLVTLAVLALIFVFGSIGAYDHGDIGFLQCFLQVGIAILVEWFTLSHLDN